MQSLSAFFEDNKPLAFAMMFAALLVLIIVLFLLYRVLFGRRLKTTSGGRARQPRLGIVDAFDLDRQRQLVLVRRDNVEHLVMIGGPNDVVIESSIVRTQSVAAGPAGREKEAPHPTVAAGAPVPQVPPASAPPGLAPSAGPAVSPPPRQALPFPAVGTGGAPPVAPVFPAAPSGGQSTQAPALSPAGDRPQTRTPSLDDGSAQPAAAGPARPAPPLAGRPGGSAPARAGAPAPGPAPAPAQRKPPAGATPRPAPPPRAPASLPPRPNLAASLPPRPARPITPVPPRPDAGPSGPRAGSEVPVTLGSPGEPDAARAPRPQDSAPPISVTANPPPLPGAAPPVGDAGKSAQPSPKNLETLESLEEEMAKLLGRPAASRDGSSG